MMKLIGCCFLFWIGVVFCADCTVCIDSNDVPLWSPCRGTKGAVLQAGLREVFLLGVADDLFVKAPGKQVYLDTLYDFAVNPVVQKVQKGFMEAMRTSVAVSEAFEDVLAFAPNAVWDGCAMEDRTFSPSDSWERRCKLVEDLAIRALSRLDNRYFISRCRKRRKAVDSLLVAGENYVYECFDDSLNAAACGVKAVMQVVDPSLKEWSTSPAFSAVLKYAILKLFSAGVTALMSEKENAAASRWLLDESDVHMELVHILAVEKALPLKPATLFSFI